MSELIQHTVNALSLGGLYALLALGIALIFGVMRFINFAHGELIMVGGYVLLYVATGSPLLAIAIVIAATVLLALLVERIAFRPVRGGDASTLLITSFAVSILLQNLALLTVGTVPKSVELPAGVSNTLEIAGVSLTWLALVTIAVTAVLLAAVWLLLTRTTVGIRMRAAAEDFDAARMLGVDGHGVVTLAFAVSGALAGVVAVLYVAQVGVVTPTMGLAPALVGFVATVVGGMGSLVGAALGGLLLGALTVLLQVVLPPEIAAYRDAFLYMAVIAFLVLRPGGLFTGSPAMSRM